MSFTYCKGARRSRLQHNLSMVSFRRGGCTKELLAALIFNEPGAANCYPYWASCHGDDGEGLGLFQPVLAGNPVLLDRDPRLLINLTLNGSLRIIMSGKPDPYGLPALRLIHNDQQIADMLAFVSKAWGNHAPSVKPDQVAAIRATTDPTMNDIVVQRIKQWNSLIYWYRGLKGLIAPLLN